ncbi:hypothetical protein [Ekhidna sp.]|uniref:hypothetical protein n=1 Tax=Ekhidna sp. TaxID=2608089 RepID=UPI00329886F1
MKNFICTLLLIALFILSSCSNNSENPGVDCAQSDLSLSISSTSEPTCSSTGSISVMASGGTSPYQFSIDGINFQSSNTFDGLAAGSLTIEVIDADGCTDVLNSTLESDGGISLELTATESDCINATGTIEVNASGGDGSFTYSIDGSAGQSENIFTSISTGDHEVTVTDGTGCSSSSEIYVSSTVSLSADIMPLLQRECTFSGCHNGDNGSDRNWTQKEDILSKASGIKSRTQSGSMPRSPGMLTADEVAMIACWVDDGAKDN